MHPMLYPLISHLLALLPPGCLKQQRMVHGVVCCGKMAWNTAEGCILDGVQGVLAPESMYAWGSLGAELVLLKCQKGH